MVIWINLIGILANAWALYYARSSVTRWLHVFAIGCFFLSTMMILAAQL